MLELSLFIEPSVLDRGYNKRTLDTLLKLLYFFKKTRGLLYNKINKLINKIQLLLYNKINKLINKIQLLFFYCLRAEEPLYVVVLASTNYGKFANNKTTKGGLNKVFVKTPMLAKNVDQFDISGAYSSAMRFFELPLSEPQIMGSHLTTAKELALKLDTEDVQYGLFNIVYKLPHDCSEWERPLTIVSHADGEGFTGAETDRSQWFSLKS